MVIRGNNNNWNWSRLYSNNTIQLCLMTAQIGNGGHKIYPKIIVDDQKKVEPADKYMPLYDNSKNIRIIKDAMFASTNEVRELLINLESTI